MHFEFLVEGQAELTALSILMEKIIGEYNQPHTWKIHKHGGIGTFPDNPELKPNTNDRTLLHNLPSKLRAYGEENRDDLVVVVLVDLDDKDCVRFKNCLATMLHYCQNKPIALFCIAIEELEAWYLGDRRALTAAYPNARNDVLDKYIQDSQYGTWELLANAIHPGGMSALHTDYGKRSTRVLEKKRIWAKKITPLMNVENNNSPSFMYFRDKIRLYI